MATYMMGFVGLVISLHSVCLGIGAAKFLPSLEPPTFTAACYNRRSSSCVGGLANVATQPVGKNRMPAGSVLRSCLVPTMDDHELRVPGTCNALASERYHAAGG